ncbi:Nod factor export ATP-binding protein I [Candidatus Phaeomarinobacter ectocarpi]|uniref:Nod factor export ATP-binding protein I n=1 Tax=Candidatus Phaeomarinibacter ectocarpi TaxID=1458461 RepID=X5MLB0_9HYPH|nr:ABC transporter ATP-binding protein [Candidatus Phaeomarinobacter ectocarpi]CDO58231.1 Nod factor export ATP-binding protein I [Candidatus Phaeomarinobacter ectocarpi]
MSPHGTSETAAPALEVVDLAKTYGTVTAVDGISFRVARGSTMALLGGNGAGKTTTIAMVLGLVTPTRGALRGLGFDLLRDRRQANALMNFESPYVDMPMRLTVRENLTVYARLYGLNHVRDRVLAIADDLALTEFLDRPSGKLSAGQKTRVGLAKALINEPELLLLDEPTASLDPDTADWVRSYFETYKARTGATILLASHNMGEVERLADNVLMMTQGRIVDRGTPADLLARYGRTNMEDVFLDVARGTGIRAEDAFMEGAPS